MIAKKSSATITTFDINAYEEVYRLWQTCSGVGLSGADSRQNIAVYLQRNPGMSFLAHEDGKLVGSILGGHDGRRGYIHHLAVQQDHRRRRIGRQLVEQCLDSLREEGIQKCHLFIFHENEPGIAFWEDCGWTFRQDIRVMSIHID